MGIASLQRDRPGTRNRFFWFFLSALACSIFLHFLFIQKAEHWKVSGFSAASYDTIVPRTFRMKRVEIDPKTLEESEKPKNQTTPAPVFLKKEIPTVDHSETTTEANKNILSQPKEILAEKITLEKGQDAPVLSGLDWKGGENPASAGLEKALSPAPIILSEPPIKTDSSVGQGGTLSGSASHYSNLDELIEGQGNITSNTAPILMPTDLLFEYDADQLKPAATESLAKLGKLIMKNAQATFRIEGYTDSFGGDEYNLGLSLRRAEAVKSWLQKNMGIDTGRITTAGLGKSHLLVPSTGTVEQQQLNRRVEIVISTR